MATIQEGVAKFQSSGNMLINQFVFGGEDFVASDYLVCNNNDFTENLMDENQATNISEDNNQPGKELLQTLPPPSDILTPIKTIFWRNYKRKHHSGIRTASLLEKNSENKRRKREKNF